MTAKGRLSRDQVEESLTWDLRDLFRNEEDFKKSLMELEGDIPKLSSYKGRVAQSSDDLLKLLELFEATYEKMVRLGTYCSLKQAEDGSNPKNQERSMVFGSLSSKMNANISFFNSELTAVEKNEYERLIAGNEGLKKYKRYLDDIYDKKQYLLSEETEMVLASLGEITGAPYRIYATSKSADMTFSSFQSSTKGGTTKLLCFI